MESEANVSIKMCSVLLLLYKVDNKETWPKAVKIPILQETRGL